MFKKFLDKQTGNAMWVATPSGIFQGRNNYVSDDIFVLEKAFYFTGGAKLSVGDATILIESVLAWGTTNPSF